MTLGHATGDDRCGTSVRRGVRVAAHSPRRGRLVLKTAKLYSVRFGIQKLAGTLSFWNSSVHVTQTLSSPRHTPVQKHFEGKCTHCSCKTIIFWHRICWGLTFKFRNQCLHSFQWQRSVRCGRYNLSEVSLLHPNLAAAAQNSIENQARYSSILFTAMVFR